MNMKWLIKNIRSLKASLEDKIPSLIDAYTSKGKGNRYINNARWD